MALTRLGPLLGSERIGQLFLNNLNESSTLLYGEFLNSFCKLMVRMRALAFVLGLVSHWDGLSVALGWA